MSALTREEARRTILKLLPYVKGIGDLDALAALGQTFVQRFGPMDEDMATEYREAVAAIQERLGITFSE
jgi:hypothetical protein